MVDERLLTVNEVAERLRAHPESIRRWIRQGKIRGIKLAGDRYGYRISEGELKRFISEGASQEERG